MQAKLIATEVTWLTADFDYQPNNQGLQLVQGAVRLSANVIAEVPDQFASQMVGRLLSYCDMPVINGRTRAIAEGTRNPGSGRCTRHLTRREPRCSGPHRPRQFCRGVALSGDGRIAVSASSDQR